MERGELIVAATTAANDGDLSRIEAFFHDEFVGVVPPDMSAEPDSYVGPAGAKRYFDLWRETVDGLEMTFEAFHDVGDWTVAMGEVRGSGRASGLPVEVRVAVATRIVDDKVFRMRAFPDLAAARDALV